MSIVFPQEHYVYALYRPEYEHPFYIGKGRGPRIYYHEGCARRNETCLHVPCRVIRKVWREGGQIVKVKLFEHLAEQDANAIEIELIALGRSQQWPLVNLTNGGDGISGYHYTEEQRQAMWQYASSEELPEEVRAFRSQSALRQWANPQFKAKRSQQEKTRYTDPIVVEQHRQLTRDLWQTPEYREKMLTSYRSPQTRAKMSKSRSEGPPNHVGTFEGFVSPQGVIYSPVVNLTAFCREHDLSYCGMWLVIKGKQAHHKGWTRYNP